MPNGQALTEIAIKKAKTADKPYKLSDTGGLYLLVHPNGSYYWRLKYRHLNKEKVLALGVYPDVPLKEAREKRDDAKRLIKVGTDPAELKRSEKRQALLQSVNTFEALAREWYEKRKERWTPNHAHRILMSLEKDIFPHIGSRPVMHITTQEILSVLRRVEKRDALDVTKRLRQRCASVFAYAKQTGRATDNPVTDLEGALKTRKQTHRPALAEKELPDFLKKLDEYEGEAITRLGLKLLILTFVRSNELRGATWDEFYFESKEWRIPASRMKMREEHIVPLSRHALKVLEEIRKITGEDNFVLSAKTGSKPISENTMIYALYRMGYHKRATVHGFRATASTILNESGLFAPDVIERQLAHAERNEVRAAYNRSQYLSERRKMMEWWGEYMAGNTLKPANNIIQGRFKRRKMG